jgi:outer membrane receptor protein involved in Fe transport
MIWNHAKHTLRWGGDFRRMQINTQTDINARGSFVFTGLNSGFDFSDFLLGLPQQTTVQFGENNYHFRGNSWDLFVQDEWRLRGNLTLNVGLRYEYVSPFIDISNHLANLSIAPEFLTNASFNSSDAVVPVVAGQSGVPETIVHPDRNNLAPRIGIAWKATGKTVVRAGYGMNYNTGAYQTIVQQLAFQPPFSTTATNIQAAPGDLTLANGFPAAASGTITNNFAVDPNYRLGYVQIWNLNIQRELRPTLIMNVDYTGTKGTNLDIVEAPNRTGTSVRIPTVRAFNYETSAANSHTYATSVRIRKRLQTGFSVGGTYTFSKSIDDASSIGGGATVVAQNPFDLAAERGLSVFDQRHRFTGDYMVELPFGHDKRWLRDGGLPRTILGDWNWSGSWTIATGTPYTPRVLNDATDVNRGTNGTLRADIVSGESVTLSNPSIAEWFNTAAFTLPATGQFGDARRNSIEGPGSAALNMAMTKVFQIKEGTMLEFRVQASNVFNTPQYSGIDTVVNSPTFGQVISVGAMRTIQLSGRFRF